MVLELESIEKEKAKQRQLSGLKQFDIVEEIFPERGRTREIIAEIAKVSDRTIDKVKKIQEQAPDEIKDKLKKQEISINKEFIVLMMLSRYVLE